jgi:hypothetical protein
VLQPQFYKKLLRQTQVPRLQKWISVSVFPLEGHSLCMAMLRGKQKPCVKMLCEVFKEHHGNREKQGGVTIWKCSWASKRWTMLHVSVNYSVPEKWRHFYKVIQNRWKLKTWDFQTQTSLFSLNPAFFKNLAFRSTLASLFSHPKLSGSKILRVIHFLLRSLDAI